MVKKLGIIFKRPFTTGITVFSKGDTNYALGGIYFDSTITRKAELYDMYFMGLYEVGELIFEQWKGLIDFKFAHKKPTPIAEFLVPYEKVFSDYARTAGEGYCFTDFKVLHKDEALTQYAREENELIQRLIFSKVFIPEDVPALVEMLDAKI